MPELESKTKKRNLIERLMIFFIGIPAVFALVFLLPFYKHLALNIVIILFCGVGAIELSAMLEKKDIKIPKIEAFLLGIITPLSALITITFEKSDFVAIILLMIAFMWALLSRVFAKKENLDNFAKNFIGCLAVIIYPGFFMYWLVKMSAWHTTSASSLDTSSIAIFMFLLIVFINDSAAWLSGSLFGKNNKGLIAASPNKSIAGFIGGTLCSVLLCILVVFIFYITNIIEDFARLALIFAVIGFLTSLFATLGDLAESALKRSSETKDSGNVILGRGGILDSIDSIAVAAPVYYLLVTYFFNL